LPTVALVSPIWRAICRFVLPEALSKIILARLTSPAGRDRLATKVEPGAREHIDYVPTQVVSEWFRTVFYNRRKSIDGIRYATAQRRGGKSLALFADRYDVVLSSRRIKELVGAQTVEEWELRSRHEKAWLKLVRSRTERTA
jgi:hypothetical protein